MKNILFLGYEKSMENFWHRIVNDGILIIDHYNMGTSKTESDIVDRYIGDNLIKQFSFNRQPTAYIIKNNKKNYTEGRK